MNNAHQLIINFEFALFNTMLFTWWLKIEKYVKLNQSVIQIGKCVLKKDKVGKWMLWSESWVGGVGNWIMDLWVPVLTYNSSMLQYLVLLYHLLPADSSSKQQRAESRDQSQQSDDNYFLSTAIDIIPHYIDNMSFNSSPSRCHWYVFCEWW